MNEILLVLVLKYSLVCAIIVKTDYSSRESDLMTTQSDNKLYYYLPPAHPLPILRPQQPDCYESGASSHISPLPPAEKQDFHTVPERDPVLAALILSTSLGLHPKVPGFNHPDHLPLNPYLALLLSHYGKYAPIHTRGRGIYSYAAANNYHNNKPFGAYKIYDDNDS